MDDVLKLAAGVLAVIFPVYTVFSPEVREAKRKQTLKDDIAIMGFLEIQKDTKNCAVVREHINAEIADLYDEARMDASEVVRKVIGLALLLYEVWAAYLFYKDDQWLGMIMCGGGAAVFTWLLYEEFSE